MTKEKDKNKYYCENDTCPVVFVRSPSNPHRRKVVFVSSVKESAIRKVEEATAQEISIAHSLPLSYA
ncbi:MAG TPA: hypothetical protein VMW36_01480 [Patescibacteria group bacterium]|nr:hypothetical protein [Patescibacteria group bacterium]